MGFLFRRMPTAYLPDEDQGILMVQVMLQANSTMEQTQEVLDKVRDYFLTREKEAVESCFTSCGAGFMLRGQNVGMSYVRLKDWKLRERPDMRSVPSRKGR